jgi:hypothetical protein
MRNALIIIFLVYGLFGAGFLDLLDKPEPEPAPPPTKILNINTPTSEIANRVQIFSNLITDPTDRAKLAIFNYEFANRVGSYSASSQEVNDVYTIAGKTFFNNTLVDKYNGLSESLTDLLKEIIGDENHELTQNEKNKLSEYFLGIAWVLIQKG